MNWPKESQYESLQCEDQTRLAVATGVFLTTAFFYLTININEINNKLLPSYKTPGMVTKPMLFFRILILSYFKK